MDDLESDVHSDEGIGGVEHKHEDEYGDESASDEEGDIHE